MRWNLLLLLILPFFSAPAPPKGTLHGASHRSASPEGRIRETGMTPPAEAGRTILPERLHVHSIPKNTFAFTAVWPSKKCSVPASPQALPWHRVSWKQAMQQAVSPARPKIISASHTPPTETWEKT